jgi:23S rRNA pseudouridine1911/1915/1917 synthase
MIPAPQDADDGGDDEADADTEPELARSTAAEHAITVEPDRAGERIDALIAAVVSGLSRATVQKLIDGAQIRINGAIVGKPGQRVRAGDRIAVVIPAPEPIDVVAENIPLVVLYEDADVIVID